MQWKLYETEPPEAIDYLRNRNWMNLRNQPGFLQRADEVVRLVELAFKIYPDSSTITDLGCGDGSLLAMIRLPNDRKWGYEIGRADVQHAFVRGLDVRTADILVDRLNYGDVLVASEVLEHLADPDSFLKNLPPRPVVFSSPSAETDVWHNEIHAWAWDYEGYGELMRRNGYEIIVHSETYGGMNTFAGVTEHQSFQAVLAVKK